MPVTDGATRMAAYISFARKHQAEYDGGGAKRPAARFADACAAITGTIYYTAGIISRISSRRNNERNMFRTILQTRHHRDA